ncbi:MAG: stilbene synthase [Verrucomicrobia bacterium]|nr:stilbene synthase [Verrucomicrobiota bacterium]
MYLEQLATAVPKHVFTQRELWDMYQQTDMPAQLTPRSQDLVKQVLNGDSGIDKRHFATPEVDRLFCQDAESLNELFEKEAPALALESLEKALDEAGWKAASLDALIVCTCTGYICPGISSYVAEQLGLRSNLFMQDLVGLGCGAAIPMMRSASGFLKAEPEARIATVAVEICSAAFYIDNSPGVIISACLFGDGAATALWTGSSGNSNWRIENFDTLHMPQHRECLRFENRAGKLRNKLEFSVPKKAAKAVGRLFKDYCKASETPQEFICHGGGRNVLDALEETVTGFDLSPAREVLRQYGNVSSPSVLFALQHYLQNDPVADHLWLTSFGAGFSAHSCALRRD